jgi:hypothetical protein
VLDQLKSGEITYKQFIRLQERHKNQLEGAFKNRKNKKESKGSFTERWMADRGYTAVHPNPATLKPAWSNAAAVIVNSLKPIDVPSPQDRRVIVALVNEINRRLTAMGYRTTNADIQAILWYPEKDLWAKLRGEEESNLKSSYHDQFLKLAIARGLEDAARATAARVADERNRAARNRGDDSGRQDGRVSGPPDGNRSRSGRGRTGGPLSPGASRPRNNPNQRSLDFGTSGSMGGNPDQLAFDFNSPTPPKLPPIDLNIDLDFKPSTPAAQKYIDKLGPDLLTSHPNVPPRQKLEQIDLFFRDLGGGASIVRNARDYDGLASPIRVTGTALQNVVTESPQVDFIGEKIRTDRDLALKAQALRNPGFETFYLLGIDAKDNMAGAMAITARSPFEANIHISDRKFDDWKDFLNRIGAKRFYILHNHPSGDPRPSSADIAVTHMATREMKERGYELLAHVVINHRVYRTITVRKGASLEPEFWRSATEVSNSRGQVINPPIQGQSRFFRLSIHGINRLGLPSPSSAAQSVAAVTVRTARDRRQADKTACGR